ncbi:MAG: rane protein insertase YidC [Verrucomicrobiaceae bacterium]|nr:rane protein insertase YidC [Verrucomicrobiaceae bacterium]
MDIQRYLLTAAIVVLSFMLMTEWVSFRQHHADAPIAASAPAIPGATAANGGNVADVPASANALATTVAESKAEANRLVRVRTDVLDIQIDREGGDIVYAALPQYSAKLETPNEPFVLLEQSAKRDYVAKSELVGLSRTSARPLYQSSGDNFELKEGADALTVALTIETEQHLIVTKTFTLHRGNYLVDVAYHVENHGDTAWQGSLYGQLKRDSSEDPSVFSGGFGVSSFMGFAINRTDPTSTKNDGYHKIKFKDIATTPLKLQQQGGWIALVQHYFLSAWVPAADQPIQYATNALNGINVASFTGPTQSVAPNSSADFVAHFYAGPKDQYRLRTISPGLDLSVDYGWQSPIAQPLFWLLTKIHGLLGNWGWSIMVLTLMVKAAFFWLNAKAYISMANMRRVQPKLVEIRERYADDKQKQSQEMMSLYKTEKINPIGGCLPVLVQMPVFLALYSVLLESVELRHAPWILWIKDLSAMDPYYVLPLLMGATMFIQQKLNPPPPDPMQAKVMQWMPVMFTFFFLWFPAGLVLYYAVNNMLSIAQQYVITKRIIKTP